MAWQPWCILEIVGLKKIYLTIIIKSVFLCVIKKFR
jgi:hypothetical protein